MCNDSGGGGQLFDLRGSVISKYAYHWFWKTAKWNSFSNSLLIQKKKPFV